jgi:hypothetical protein
MTRDEALRRLTAIKEKGNRALQLLDSKPLTAEALAEIQDLARWLKEELQAEYRRMLPERSQKTMSMFELTVYSPTIEEAWKHSGIKRLRIEEVPDQRWKEPLEAAVYQAGKYLS